jgi:protein-S-isoprenylcysteine O-methyltransferase Ste14
LSLLYGDSSRHVPRGFLTDIQSKHGGANVRVPPPLFFVVGIATGWALQHYVAALPLASNPQGALIAAAVTGVAGLALIVAALGLFKRTGQEPEPWKPSPELIGRGPYRFTRNPMYVGMFLLQCAVGFGVNNAWIVLLAPLALLGVHFAAVLPEERYLTDKFGASYSQYVARTARYFGWPR